MKLEREFAVEWYKVSLNIATMPPHDRYPDSLEHIDIMLTDDGSRTLRDRQLDETFHSGCGALSDCWHCLPAQQRYP